MYFSRDSSLMRTLSPTKKYSILFSAMSLFITKGDTLRIVCTSFLVKMFVHMDENSLKLAIIYLYTIKISVSLYALSLKGYYLEDKKGDNMLSVGDRIREVRKKLRVNQDGLAKILGCTDGKIKGLEQGKTSAIKPKDIDILSLKYGFNPEWLDSGIGEMMIDKGELLLKEISITEALLSSSIAIPYYKDINASAGHGCLNGECKAEYIKLSADMLPGSVNIKELDAIRVSGNSMTPTIQDEDIIFVDKSEAQAQNGKIFVVYLCDEVYVKRVFIDPVTKKLSLASDNPVFPTFAADCEDFKIIGRVVANMQISKL